MLLACNKPNSDLQQAEKLMGQHPDSALHILRRITANDISGKASRALYALLMSQAMDKNDIKSESDSLITIATNYYGANDPERAGYAWFYHARTASNRGDAQEQADNLLKAQEYAEQTNNYKLRGLIYGDKGLMYRSQRQLDSSVCYYKKAFNSFVKVNDLYNSILGLLCIGGDFVRSGKLDSALVYFHVAANFSDKISENELLSSMYRNIGSAYLMKKDYNKALYYYTKVPLTGTPIYDNNKWLLIADVFLRKGVVDSTRYYLNKAKALKKIAPNYYELWMKINEKNGNYKLAVENAKNIILANDSLNDINLKESFAGLEKKYRYQGLQLANQKLEIKNSQKNVYLLLALFLFSIAILLFVLWQLSVKKRLLLKEKALVKIEKEKAEKSRENNLLLEKQVKFQNILLLNIEQHRKNAILRPHKKGEKPEQSKANFYDELIACMDLEYNDISHRLKKQFPNLTQQDILICCLLLAGFDTGMMASILDVKNESMHTRRSRLRTKLDLSSSANLLEFLRRF